MARITHFEIHATDPDRAMAFYSAVFGWSFSKWDGPMEYWGISTGDESLPGINGGMMRRRGPSPESGQPVNAFSCLVSVDDLDALIAAATKHGGSLAVPRMAISGVGWLVYLHDTEGNIVGAMQEDSSAR